MPNSSEAISSKDEYLKILKSELDRVSGNGISSDAVEVFLTDIEEHFERFERRGRTVLYISERLGSPRRLARLFEAYASVRSKRPAFTISGRLKHSARSFKAMFFSFPLRALLTLTVELPVALIAVLGWLIAAVLFGTGVVGIYALIARFHFSNELQAASALFFAGLLFFSHPAFRFCRRATFFAAGLIWSVNRMSAMKRLDAVLGDDR